jgi:lysophospholipase L1-like esterase
VVWDGMAQLGAFTSRMLYFDADHIRDQIAHRDAGLLVFMFGGNDLLLPSHRLDEYEDDFRNMLKRFRAQPKPPDCLVMSPVDHGVREGQRIVSNPMVAKITAIQREVAFEQGCAFFDTQAAMGGDGSVARWRKSNPPRISGDLAHLTDAGQKVLGHMLYVAILQRYVEYRGRKG